MADRLTEIEELAIELAEERTLHQTTLARVRELETALRRVERIAAEHDGVNEDAYELITDETRRAALAPAEERADGRADK